ncbi:hypothetical protein WN48_03692, partial [Eufriesea mexicana]
MGINPMKWKTRSLLYTSLILIIFYVLFVYKKKHYVQVEGIIKNSDPIHVREFIADFSNIKKLNPTIEEFDIITEGGTADHWKYSVEYTEHLSYLPIRNTARGHYDVFTDKNGYLITSKHQTCFFSGFGCLESISQFRFDVDGATDTKCIETVQYECPIVFSLLCYKEVMYQREEIMKGLKSKFSVTK